MVTDRALQMIPGGLKYTVEGSTPSFTDNSDQTIERGTQERLRIKGIRGEMGSMYAIGSIREDYLG
jgi:DNA-directed RNA polymerase II subunit RPB7